MPLLVPVPPPKGRWISHQVLPALTLTIPAGIALATRNASRHILGEDADLQAIVAVERQLERFGLVLEGENGNDRAESFLAVDFHLARDAGR